MSGGIAQARSALGEAALARILGESDLVAMLRGRIISYATETDVVLIQGETGTGKELVARALHANSLRAGGPFVPVNCASIPAELFESEVFGHVKGAFTNAVANRPGEYARANGGVLFLDEIGQVLPTHQSKLLRALDDNTIRAVGASREQTIDVRVIAATSADLQALISEGRFQIDLYYRLCVLRIQVPPLRDRVDDVVLLARLFLAEKATTATPPRDPVHLGKRAEEQLRKHPWPGNVRELRAVMARVHAERRASVDDLSAHLGCLPEARFSPSQHAEQAIADVVFADLMAGRTPLDGLQTGSTQMGALAARIIEGIERGFSQYLETEAGRQALSNLTTAGLLERVGLSARAGGHDRILIRQLRRHLTEILRDRVSRPQSALADQNSVSRQERRGHTSGR